jgi:integrase/recombinase XerC
MGSGRPDPANREQLLELVHDQQQPHVVRLPGRRPTSRRYDHLWQRFSKHLPWVATQQISTHWLRHTTLSWVWLW